MNSNGYHLYLYTRNYKGFAEAAAAETLYVKPKGENAKREVAAKAFATNPTLITLHKRGRKYYTTIDNGPAGEEGRTDSLTLLRTPKRLTMFAHKYGDRTGDTVVNLDWVKLTKVD